MRAAERAAPRPARLPEQRDAPGKRNERKEKKRKSRRTEEAPSRQHSSSPAVAGLAVPAATRRLPGAPGRATSAARRAALPDPTDPGGAQSTGPRGAPPGRSHPARRRQSGGDPVSPAALPGATGTGRREALGAEKRAGTARPRTHLRTARHGTAAPSAAAAPTPHPAQPFVVIAARTADGLPRPAPNRRRRRLSLTHVTEGRGRRGALPRGGDERSARWGCGHWVGAPYGRVC